MQRSNSNHLQIIERATDCKKYLCTVTCDDQPGSHIVTYTGVKNIMHGHITVTPLDHHNIQPLHLCPNHVDGILRLSV